MILTVHAKPNAKQTEIAGWLDETTVKIKIAAPAIEGKANRALLKFLAELYQTSPSCLSLVRGATTRIKQIEIPDVLFKNLAKKS